MGFGDRSTGRGIFGGEFGAHQCNQWGLYGVRVRQCRDAALFPNYFGQTCLLLCVAGRFAHDDNDDFHAYYRLPVFAFTL